ncbi:MAG: hypothetical protein GY948_17545 [Alphaproteobacteria bacterium]|nr:hypothetical protein [Alphaproteobacteria bacterium]
MSDSDFDGPDFSRVILMVLRRLDAEFPNRTDLTTCKRILVHEASFGRLWAWLSEQGIVSGPVSNCALTLSGKKSFGSGLESVPKLASGLMHDEDGLEGEDATKALLAVMRHHYETFHMNARK